jgi:hypothetical protein
VWDDILSVAPSENQTPRNPFIDKHAEEMTYCSLFGGKPRPKLFKPVSYHKICKWELRHKNRRFARHKENLFFKTRKSMLKLLADLEMISMKKVVKRDGSKYTAKDLKKNRENILLHDEGYKFLKSVRGSPPYFEKIKKNLFAMMRFHGKPTFFVTFSAAENHWHDLMKKLGKLIDNRDYTHEEIENMSKKEKQRLITADPITCARHFNHRTRILFSDFLKSAQGPLGEMKEFFYRVEFQHRGSPHLHCLLWIKDAPILGEGNEEVVAAYVDKYVTCSKSLDVPYLSLDEKQQLISRQTHRHTRTCPHKNKVCRFNFPKPPMDKTTILQPFDKGTKEKSLSNEQKKELAEHKANFKKIEETLNNWANQPQNKLINTMDEFLDYLKMSYSDYISAVRSSIHTDTVFLERKVDERWINGYNRHCLAVWKANMDCQYVVNGYAAASYILDYVTKGERGLSETLRVASKEAALKQMKNKDSVKHIANRFINYVETGAQEAAYYLLGIQLYNSSNSVIFIPTAEDSARLCKPEAEYMEMDDDDDNIFMKNSTDRYIDRPKILRNICLAEYVAYYDGLGSYEKSVKEMNPDEEFAPEKESEQVDDDLPPAEETTEKKQGLKKRKKPRIIRYVNFNRDTHEEEHYRELLMLFYPFSNLDNLMGGCSTYKERYQQHQVKLRVDQEHSIYSKYEEEFRGLENVNTHPDEEDEFMATLAPGTEQMAGDQARRQREAEQHLPLPETTPSALLSKSYHHENEWSEGFYHQQVGKLNKKQFQFVNEFLNHLKVGPRDKQLLWFLSGGAGVGKTTAVNVLYEGARRFFNSIPGQDHSALQIVKCAFTGKASHQVRGYTINTLFKMPFGTKKKREQLTGSKLGELQAKLGDLKVLIIDEISMVDNEMWVDMSHRLCKIKQIDDLPFGGVHVLAVGDLFQLLPVMGRPLWQMEHIDAHSQVKGYPLGNNVWKDQIKMFELDEIMRQKDEKKYAELLNRLRESPLSDADLQYLKGQIIPKDSDIIPDASYIALTNDKCEKINDHWFFMAPKENQYRIKAIDTHAANAPVPPHVIEENIAKVSRGDVQSLFSELKLAIGHEYDFVINLDTIDGITNGTPCIVKKYQSNSSKGDIIWVDPQDPSVGKRWRQAHMFLYDSSIPKHWLPVLRYSHPCKAKFFTRKQFPLRPAKCRTVHRCQGGTYCKIALDLSDGRNYTAHGHYVALSRCPSLANVSIIGPEGLAESKITHDTRCIQEMERLRLDAKMELLLPCLFNLKDNFNSIYFLNAQSISGKMAALERDWNIQGSSVLGIIDTRFEKGNERELPGFTQPSVFFSHNERPSLGVAVYSKLCHAQGLCQLLGSNQGSIVSIKYPNFYVVDNNQLDVIVSFVYIMPEASSIVYSQAAGFFEKLANQNLSMIVIGDFNKSPTALPGSFSKRMKELGLNQLIDGPTHNRGNTLDHLYTNIGFDYIKFGILNSLTKSDHMPIFISVKKVN